MIGSTTSMQNSIFRAMTSLPRLLSAIPIAVLSRVRKTLEIVAIQTKSGTVRKVASGMFVAMTNCVAMAANSAADPKPNLTSV